MKMPAMTAHLAGMPEGATMNILVTMVLTLLNIAGPCTTYFGEKDWQQLVMFQRMAEDLRLPSRLHRALARERRSRSPAAREQVRGRHRGGGPAAAGR